MYEKNHYSQTTYSKPAITPPTPFNSGTNSVWVIFRLYGLLIIFNPSFFNNLIGSLPNEDVVIKTFISTYFGTNVQGCD